MESVGENPALEILALLRPESRFPAHYPSVKTLRLDSFQTKEIDQAMEKFRPNIVIHGAAIGMELSQSSLAELIRFNVQFSINLLESFVRVGGGHFIFIGTGYAYRPLSRPLREDDAMDTLHPYGASKAAADLLVRSAAVDAGLPITVLRPFSFTGLGDDRQRLFPSLLRAAMSGYPLELTPGNQARDHVSARDVAAGIQAAMDHPPSPGIPAVYNLGSGSSCSVRQLLENIVEELGLQVDLRFGAKSVRPFEPDRLIADISKAEQDLQWRPRHTLAHAVWQLARDSFPGLKIREPREIFV